MSTSSVWDSSRRPTCAGKVRYESEQVHAGGRKRVGDVEHVLAILTCSGYEQQQHVYNHSQFREIDCRRRMFAWSTATLSHFADSTLNSNACYPLRNTRHDELRTNHQTEHCTLYHLQARQHLYRDYLPGELCGALTQAESQTRVGENVR